MILPNFLIVGAPKAGTSTLAAMLSEHPDCFMARRELHFFNDHFDRGVAHYSSFFAAANGHCAVGEKTPEYCRSFDMPFLAKRIRDTLGEGVRLIWILRDPPSRALSHYRHALVAKSSRYRRYIMRSGAIVPFDEIVAEELRLGEGPLLSFGLYCDQVEFYSRHFPRENLRLYLFEDLLREPADVLRDLARFLGIDDSYYDQATLKSVNVSAERLPGKNLLRLDKARQLLGAIRRGQIVDILRERRLATKNFDTASQDTLAALREFYRPHNKRLQTLTGLKLSEVWG